MPLIVGYKRARELLYFDDRIDARTALDIGHDQVPQAIWSIHAPWLATLFGKQPGFIARSNSTKRSGAMPRSDSLRVERP